MGEPRLFIEKILGKVLLNRYFGLFLIQLSKQVLLSKPVNVARYPLHANLLFSYLFDPIKWILELLVHIDDVCFHVFFGNYIHILFLKAYLFLQNLFNGFALVYVELSGQLP